MRTFCKIFLLTLLCLGFVARAQGDRDKVAALRMTFIAKKVQLTSQEADKFWPVYNEFQDKLSAIRRNLRQSYARAGQDPGEEQALELYHLEIQSRQAEADLYRTYSEKLKAIIGVTKLARLRIAEDQFRKEIINNLRERSDG